MVCALCAVGLYVVSTHQSISQKQGSGCEIVLNFIFTCIKVIFATVKEQRNNPQCLEASYTHLQLNDQRLNWPHSLQYVVPWLLETWFCVDVVEYREECQEWSGYVSQKLVGRHFSFLWWNCGNKVKGCGYKWFPSFMGLRHGVEIRPESLATCDRIMM